MENFEIVCVRVCLWMLSLLSVKCTNVFKVHPRMANNFYSIFESSNKSE